MSSAYIHAALVLYYAGQAINEENIKKVLEAAGVQVDEARVKALSSALSEVNIDEAIKSAPTIGFAAPAAAPQAAAPTAPAEEAKPKKEEKKEEEKKEEEEALAGLSALFG